MINWLQDQSKYLGMGIESACLVAAWLRHELKFPHYDRRDNEVKNIQPQDRHEPGDKSEAET